jgi:hypothetical protein
MITSLGAQCDDFYASSRLSLKLDLALGRETILQFFERVQRDYPAMRRLRRRNDGGLTLGEGDPDTRESESRRWVRLELPALRFGFFTPPSRASWRQFGGGLLTYAPYYLSINDLDIEHLEVTYGFDMEYSGNHDLLVADTLMGGHPLAGLLTGEECQHVIDCQPYLGIALTPECHVQAYMEVKSRTSTFEVRTGEFESQLLSVYLTVRRYWGFDRELPLAEAFTQLADAADELAIRRVVPGLVNPLAQAIASRP